MTIKDNALRIMLFVYIFSGMMVVVDTQIAGPMGIQLQTFDGQPAGPMIHAIHQEMAMNAETIRMLEETGQMDFANSLEAGAKSLELGLAMSGEMVKFLTGWYAFDIMRIFGVPWEVISIITGVYCILVARALIGYMPAIAAAVRALVSLGRGVGSAASAVGGAVGGIRP